jgi:hypothetical protein
MPLNPMIRALAEINNFDEKTIGEPPLVKVEM